MNVVVKVMAAAAAAYFATPYIAPHVEKLLPAVDTPLAKQAVGAGVAAGVTGAAFFVIGLVFKG